MKTMATRFISVAAVLLGALPGLARAETAPAVEFKPDEAKGRMQVLIGGREALVYVHGKDVDLPHFFPVRSPSGKPMTVQQIEPYPHHRSFWFADTVQLEGQRQVSFYNALYSGAGDKKNPRPPFRDRVRQVSFTPPETAAGKGRIGFKLVWEMDDGKTPVLDETRDLRVVALGEGEYFLDLTFTLKASYGDVAFKSDAAHYAWPYIRMNSDFNTNNSGVLVNSEGATGQAGTHEKPAHWVDFSRTGVSDPEGLALFSHPSNPQPHTWLTRDYGTFGPRREAARNGQPFTLKRGETISTRCGVLVHKGNAKTGRVAGRYAAYAGGKL
jgi:hypothetical protein